MPRYANPRPFQGWRNAFDIGEFGIGIMTNSLELGCDCLGEIHYFDVALTDGNGQPYTIRQAICLHEEDSGLLWKHFDATLGTTETRRSRRLVISSIITAENYEYAIYWYFYQDGTIEFEVKLTGIVVTSALPPDEISDFGSLVARGTLAAHHQHSLSARLDMAVDRLCNTVYEVDTEATPWSRQPAGQRLPAGETAATPGIGGAARDHPLRGRLAGCQSGQEDQAWVRACLQAHPRQQRPGFSHPNAPVTRRAAFAAKHLWVTPFSPEERFPAGDDPNQHAGGAGLPPGPKPTARPRTRTLCSGTPWAVTTSPDPRTGWKAARQCFGSTPSSVIPLRCSSGSLARPASADPPVAGPAHSARRYRAASVIASLSRPTL